MTPLGAKLRQHRKARGMTLTEMAHAIDVTPTYLSALEHGKRGRPTWYLLQRMIACLGVIWDEADELQRLAELSDPRITVDTAGLSPLATELANRLARDIARLSDSDAAHLLERLKRLTGTR